MSAPRPADVRPFPWDRLPRIRRRDAELAAALAALTGASGRARAAVPGIGTLELRVGSPQLLQKPALAARLSDPSSATLLVRAGGAAAQVVVPGRLVRSLGQRLLGGPDEMDGPRSPTPAERGALAYVASAVADALAPDAQVEPLESAGPLVAAGRDAAVVLDLEVTGDAQGELAVLVPPEAAVNRRHRSLDDLLRVRRGWLDGTVDVPLVIATAPVGRDDLAALRVRDVLVADRVGPRAGDGLFDHVRLRIARGWIPTRLAPGASGLTVIADYERGASVQETLGDDATVEIAVAAGSVTLSMRRLLELAPGQVLSLGRPLGGPVELRVGARVVGRGELVNDDGELGVRVVAVEADRS